MHRIHDKLQSTFLGCGDKINEYNQPIIAIVGYLLFFILITVNKAVIDAFIYLIMLHWYTEHRVYMEQQKNIPIEVSLYISYIAR